jgi:MFS family permease
MGAFALVGGFFMDFVGRKRLAIVAFVMLGLSYSFLGLFDPASAGYPMSIWYAHIALNGVSWGILYVLFVVTVWGDLSHEMPSDKFYALGVIPFFVSKMLQLTIDFQLVESISYTAIFSFTALFLFLAVLPLIYVPETLPEKVMKERELKTYLEKAKAVAAKAQKKDEEEQEEDEDSVKFEVPQECDEEAEALAQKYY